MNSPQITTRNNSTVLVSVVIPTKGRPIIVQRAVKSALNQTLRIAPGKAILFMGG